MDTMLSIGMFKELDGYELMNVEGGFIVAVVAVGAYTFTVTAGHVVAAVGTAWALGYTAGEIRNAFR